jgi:two-component system chemotaxis response regulator CheB
LTEKVKTAAHAHVRPRTAPAIKRVDVMDSSFDPGDRIVAIGSSTGGVEALIEVLSHFPCNCPPTVITQHMPAHFTATFAERLARLSLPSVTEARDGDVLKPGHVYIAPGGLTHLEVTGLKTMRCKLTAADPVNGHRPSVDVLFKSIASTARGRAIGVLLTGMGRDGALGLSVMRAADAATIGQDEETSVVYGMPRAAFEIGAIQKQLPLEKIGPEILRLCRRSGEGVLSHARSG